MDYFVLFYTILGTAVVMALGVVALVMVLTSRETFPPLPKRSERSDRFVGDVHSVTAAEGAHEVQEKIAA